MSVFQCIDCDSHHCTDCDGGADACNTCSTGPLCNDCAADHVAQHDEERRDLDDDDDQYDPADMGDAGWLVPRVRR